MVSIAGQNNDEAESAAMWKCPTCGVYNAREGKCSYCNPAPSPPPSSKAKLLPPSLPSALRSIQAIRFGITGVVAVGIGFALIMSPGLRDDPKVLTFSDVLPGLGAIVAGFGAFGLAAYMMFRRR
jgi:hypothetical protein